MGMRKIVFAVLLLASALRSGAVALPEQAWQVWSPATVRPEQFRQENGVFLLQAGPAQEISRHCSIPAEPGEYLLSAELRCTDVENQAVIGLEAWGGGVWKKAVFSPPAKGSGAFVPVQARIEVSGEIESLKAVLLLRGPGKAEFRKVALEKAGGNPLLPDAVRSGGTLSLRVTEKETGPVNRRLFGGHYFDIRDRKTAYADMGMSVCREGGPGFFSPGRLNPDGNAWRWEDLDRFLGWSRENRVEVLGLIGGAAPWMTPDGLESPAGWKVFYERWSDFAVEVARHAGTVRHWELWNEPDGGHWFGRPWHAGAKEYAPLYLETARKLKALNPELQVGTGGIADPFRGSIDNWWVPVAKHPGVAELIDFVAIHGYYGDPANQIFARGIDHMRARMRECLGREVPLWVTEFNVHPLEDFTHRGYSFPLQAVMIAEYLALFAQKEIESSQYFCVGWWESDFSPWDGKTGAPRPVFHAYAFWKDFAGTRLVVTNPEEAELPVVACRTDEGARIAYVPARREAKLRIGFEGCSEADRVAVNGFYGDSVIPVVFSRSMAGGVLSVDIDWPQGARALLKVEVRPK